jgi:hypothetical protein
MAQRQTITTAIYCDYTGELCPDAKTLKFGWGDREYQIDLSPAIAEKFEQIMNKYADKATALPRTQKRTRRGNAKSNAVDLAKIRDWAKANGLAVSERGRIPGEIMAAYEAAMKAEGEASAEASSADDDNDYGDADDADDADDVDDMDDADDADDMDDDDIL